MKFKELQLTIEKNYPRPIRLEKTKKIRSESLHEFLVKFFTQWNQEKNTVYVDTHEVQTDINRRRSLGDIYMICKYYYPDITLEDIIRELYLDLSATITEQGGFRTSYCSTINKRVWYFDSKNNSQIYNEGKYDEFGNPYQFYLNGFLAIPLELEEDDEENDGEEYEDYGDDDDDNDDLGW